MDKQRIQCSLLCHECQCSWEECGADLVYYLASDYIIAESCSLVFSFLALTLGMWVQGLVAMSGPLELMYTALANNQVPQQWAQVSYPSLKPLGAWLKDLQARVAFFASWLRRGLPACFWLAAFFFPQVWNLTWAVNACCCCCCSLLHPVRE